MWKQRFAGVGIGLQALPASPVLMWGAEEMRAALRHPDGTITFIKMCWPSGKASCWSLPRCLNTLGC